MKKKDKTAMDWIFGDSSSDDTTEAEACPPKRRKSSRIANRERLERRQQEFLKSKCTKYVAKYSVKNIIKRN